jgi:hypothetical protein
VVCTPVSGEVATDPFWTDGYLTVNKAARRARGAMTEFRGAIAWCNGKNGYGPVAVSCNRFRFAR